MNLPLKIVGSRNTKARLLIVLTMIAAIIFCWFAVRWQIGNMFAELTAPTDPNAAEIASFANSLAPSDPMPVWLAATKIREEFTAEAASRSAEAMKEAIRRSPMDHRWWIELGRASEQSDQPDAAILAFERAIQVAPEYTFPRWQYGNFLLRQDQTDNAFVHLRKATEKSSVFREQVFSLAWDYFDKDPQRVESLAADSPDVRANLALFYAVRSASEDSLRMWDSLPDEKKAEHIATAKVIAQGLYDKGLYRQSLEFARQTGIDSEAVQETVSNGGFETSWGSAENTLFGWKVIRTEGRVDIQADTSVKKEGDRSVKINFRSYERPEYYNLSQVVTVQPGARYRLSFFVRTEGLTSAGRPMVQVWNSKDNVLIAQTQPFPSGTNDWQQVTVEFTAPETLQGVELRTVRDHCGEGCPLIGIMWYDDFRLQKL